MSYSQWNTVLCMEYYTLGILHITSLNTKFYKVDNISLQEIWGVRTININQIVQNHTSVKQQDSDLDSGLSNSNYRLFPKQHAASQKQIALAPMQGVSSKWTIGLQTVLLQMHTRQHIGESSTIKSIIHKLTADSERERESAWLLQCAGVKMPFWELVTSIANLS